MTEYRRKVGIYRQPKIEPRRDRVLVPGSRGDGWRDGNGSFFHSDARAGKIDDGVALFNDEESMKLLRQAVARVGGFSMNEEHTRAVLELLINPPKPKPEEPKYLGAKVVDKGVLWEALIEDAEGTGGMVWFRVNVRAGQDWDAFSDDVKILFDGYEPNRVS